ncbi:MAG: DUF4261 domain-containing protein [Agathobacter sp.]|nr:DUF4261 domain-containing protein [Agathobacter sp.]
MDNYVFDKMQVVEWLMHPNELGCKPKKIEFTREFTDEDGIVCKIFKYKKSLMSPWLLAISSDSGVFSEMKKYDEKTEIDDAKELLAFLKDYWKRMAASEEEREERMENASNFMGFVLFKDPVFNPEEFENSFAKEWGISLGEGKEDMDENSDEDSDVDSRVYGVDSMLLVLGYMGFPVPDGEAEANAQFNYMWPDAVTVTQTHKAHVIVTVMGEGSIEEKAKLYTKAITTLCRQENTLGVYANEVVQEAKMFAAMSEIMEDGSLPIFNLVWFGLSRSEEGVSAYTCGLKCFGKDEIEIVNSDKQPSEIRDMLINIADYVISEDVYLHDGETIGLTADQRLKITKSEGVNVEGESLKIAY